MARLLVDVDGKGRLLAASVSQLVDVPEADEVEFAPCAHQACTDHPHVTEVSVCCIAVNSKALRLPHCIADLHGHSI